MTSRYPKTPFVRGSASGAYSPGQGKVKEKVIPLRHNPPGNIILVHGVNDLGTSYAAIEEGLCKGLSERLDSELTPAKYRLPLKPDREQVEKDPDAVFFKRTVTKETLSPVIPFYWGYSEEEGRGQGAEKTIHGQNLDRYGNRLDPDNAKGGGTFANATSTLPDMWNKGKSGLHRALDVAQKDATHPVLDNPGRMYMVLAARRLAALICMIRDYDDDEVVSIVAHSQGCLIALLAQAFLISPELRSLQPNARPIDALILTHPPYSLIEETPMTVRWVDYFSGEDRCMAGRYERLAGSQTLHARMTTLSNIVRGVWEFRRTNPPLASMSDTQQYFGAVGKKWSAASDRDNRGKTYLYFCPEDMTVALANVQGIGWQGIPDRIVGSQIKTSTENGATRKVLVQVSKEPLKELGSSFFQRVFTRKRRPDPLNGAPVLVGLPGEYFELRKPGENDQDYTAVSDGISNGYFARAHLETAYPANKQSSLPLQGRRLINGEPLKRPVQASLLEGSIADKDRRPGAAEMAGPDDAVIAITSAYGINEIWELIQDPVPHRPISYVTPGLSSNLTLHNGRVAFASDLVKEIGHHLNDDKRSNAEKCKVLKVEICLEGGGPKPRSFSPGRLLIQRTETANEARLRWQHAQTSRSFHGAIWGGSLNHRQVTAYDVAIGGAKAIADPAFNAYLCAVADWRLQTLLKKGERTEKWDGFLQKHGNLFAAEPNWRKTLMRGSADYYSTGILPAGLPLFPEGLPASVLAELTSEITRQSIEESNIWSS